MKIRHAGEKHSTNTAVSSHLAHPLILSINRLGFNRLVEQCVRVLSQLVGTWDMCAVLSSDEEGEPPVLSKEVPQVPMFKSTEDFPLEQPCDDTLHFGFDQVIKVDSHLVRPE